MTALTPQASVPLAPRGALPRATIVGLTLMPLVVMIVPQGTIARTYVPETLFAAAVAVVLLLVHLSYRSRGLWPLWARHRLLALMLSYLLIASPLIALVGGADLTVTFLTAVPFTLVGVFYALGAMEFNEPELEWLARSYMVAGIWVGLQLGWVWASGNLDSTAGRATGFEGEKTLILPILPMAGMLVLVRSLLSSNRFIRWACTGTYLFLAWAILITVTRAMLLAFTLGSIVVFCICMFRARMLGIRTRVASRLMVLGFGLVVAAAPVIQAWAMRMGRDSEDWLTALGRLDEISAFLEGWRSSPIWGRGLGTVFSYPSEFDMTLRDKGITVPHNSTAFFLGAGGVLGLFLYYGTLIPDLIRSMRGALKTTSAPHLIRHLGWGSALLVGITFTLTSTTYTTLSYNLFLGSALFALRRPEAQ